MHFKDGLSVAIAGISVVLVQSYTQAATALTAPEVSQIGKQVTVRIEFQAEGRKQQGSGFIIKKTERDYHVLTALHVVSPDAKYTLVAPDGERYNLDAQKFIYKEGTDLAVIRFSSPKTYQVAKIGNSDSAAEGTTVYVAGFPARTSTVTSSELYRFLPGQVTANSSKPLDEGYSLVYTNPTMGGMSGGPVFNDKGEVVGVHGRAETQAQVSGDNFKVASTGNNLGISINTFLRLALLDLGVKPPAIATATTSKADEFILQGANLTENKDYRGAIAAYDKALQINPKLAQGYYKRGTARYELKEYAAASADYSRAIELDAKFTNAYFNRALVRYQLKEYDKALADYSQAIALNPKDVDAYNNRGNLYSRLKQYDKALADSAKAIALDAKFPNAYITRGNVRYEQQKYTEALADFERAIALDPKSAIAYNNRGLVRDALKQYDKALADYSQAIALDPKYPPAYSNRGTLRYAAKEYESAIEDFGRAIELEPEYAEARNNRANVSYELGNKDAAIGDWRKAIELGVQSPPTKMSLGVALYTNGQREEGLQLWQDGVKSLGKIADLEALKGKNAGAIWLQVLKGAGWGDSLLEDAAKLLEDPRL